MKASGGKSTLQLAASEEVVMLLLKVGAMLPLPLHVGVVMPSHPVSGTMGMHQREIRRTLMGTAWGPLQAEATQVVVVARIGVEVVGASIRKGRGALRLSALRSKSLPNVVGAQVGGAVDLT